MTFKSVKNLAIFNLTLSKCGLPCNNSSNNNIVPNMEDHMTTIAPALYLLNCSYVNLSHLSILNDHGTRLGAALLNIAGNVSITDCLFEAGGGGLYVTTNFTKNVQEDHVTDQHDNDFKTHPGTALMTITRCNFTNNKNSQGSGGGLATIISGMNGHYSVRISDCYFVNNTAAVSGGGLFIKFKLDSSNNSVVIENCTFIQNKCHYGGGGACAGFNVESHISVSNVISFSHCLFQDNTAFGNGGGLSLYSHKGMGFALMKNWFHLENCQWMHNNAFVASALDVAPAYRSHLDAGSLPYIIIDNCSFDSNVCNNRSESNSSDKHFTVSINGLATVLISGFRVKFKQWVIFRHNYGTGLHLSLASVNISEGSCLYFEGNTGKHGGGITMVAFSQLTIHNNCKLMFINNTSLTRGGAFNVQFVDYQHEAYFSSSW